ncbi:sec-independent protein translocase protein TatC [Desulfitispora alkaliphila]|uniref:twin-arginine translocase subunit TatC n=1 Tax=Desulfitispora alkaliphila TaxID=622674 RepID=UPI003D2543D6
MSSTSNHVNFITELLQDIRKSFFLIIMIFIIGTIGGYYYSPTIMHFLFRGVDIIIFISPTEGFITTLKISLIVGGILSVPFVTFTILNFLKKRFVNAQFTSPIVLTVICYILFLVGGFFAIVLTLPISIQFLLGFGTEDLQPMLSAGRYVSFASILTFAFGITFQMPVFINVLSKAGLLTSTTLKEKRKYIFLLMFVIGGLISPPDIISQFLLAIPLVILYEISVFIASAREKKRKKVSEDLDENKYDKGYDKEIVDDLMDEFTGVKKNNKN